MRCSRVQVVDPGIFLFSSSLQMLSNMLDSTLVILGLLEFCVAVAVLAFGYDTVRQHTYTQLVREAGIPGNPWESLEIPGMLIHPFLPPKERLQSGRSWVLPREFPWISLVLLSQAL